jgi:hypothetical protein
MGSFYTNVTVRNGDVDEVARVLEKEGRTAFVSPVERGCCVVFDQATESQDSEVLEKLVKLLSKRLKCAALAVLIHDDDLLFYTLYESGRQTDEYASRPGFADGRDLPPEGGAARALAAAFDAHARAGVVERILHEGEYALETERHAELVAALGLPEAAVGTGYHYITEGELPPGLAAEQLRAVGEAELGEEIEPSLPQLTPEEEAVLKERLNRELRPSPELAAIVGAEPMVYSMVVVKVAGYVVRNGLATPSNEIRPDAKLAKVVGSKPIPYASLASHLDRHLTPC